MESFGLFRYVSSDGKELYVLTITGLNTRIPRVGAEGVKYLELK